MVKSEAGARTTGSEIEIRGVRTTKEKKLFIEFPRLVYKNNPRWVQPLLGQQKKFFDPRTNPFYEHGEVDLFIAIQDGRCLGRIAAIWNRLYDEFQNEKAGFFGCFEVVDNFMAAKALLERAMEWAKKRGLQTVYGPASFSANEEYGLLIEGFDSPPAIMMPYNPPYYAGFIEACGFVLARDLLAYLLEKERFSTRIRMISDRVQKQARVRLRTIDMRRLDREVETIKGLYNRVLEDIWGFVPMSDSEIHHLAADLRKIIDPKLVIFAEVENKPVGFILSIPDINQVLIKLKGRLFPFGVFKLLWQRRKIDQIRVAAMGVLPEYRRSGIETWLYSKTLETCIEGGRYLRAELSFVLEDNKMMNKSARALGAYPYKRYRIYKRLLKA